ncbi:MAG TPA: short-chain dehydrogenase [Anaerolineaceae bacterium]|nr:short-chain dehydrogenase [Anaerolineaceae bacterium]
MKSNYYQGKSVLITGGSSGIGFSLANALVAMDAKVILLARDYENLKIAKTAILEKYPKAKVKIVPVDVTDEKTLALLYNKYMRNHEIPDILINCAGVARPGYVQELPAHVFRWTMDIDYFGTVNMVRLLLPGMLKRGTGHIINVSSIAGVIGTFGYTAYCGAKFAVKGFSDALRSEVKPKGIRVSVLYPPDTDTPQLAWEDQYKPKETKAISGTAKPISPDLVAQQTLKDAARGKYAIVPGFEAKLMYFAGTRLGNWIYPIMDMMVRSALKKTK